MFKSIPKEIVQKLVEVTKYFADHSMHKRYHPGGAKMTNMDLYLHKAQEVLKLYEEYKKEQNV